MEPSIKYIIKNKKENRIEVAQIDQCNCENYKSTRKRELKLSSGKKSMD